MISTKRNIRGITFTAILLVSATGLNLNAEEYVLANSDFEMGSPGNPNPSPGGTSYIGNIPGWNVVNAGGVFEPDFISGFSYPAPVQATTGDFVAFSTNNGFGMISVFIGGEDVFRSDAIYVLSVDVGHRLDETFAGGFGFARLTNPFPTGVSVSAVTDPGPGNFSRQTHVFNGKDIPASDVGDPFRLIFYASPDNSVVDFDNVRFEIIVPGDINLDGAVNLLDVAGFIDLISNGTFQEEADTNRDGAVNLLDVDSFVAILSGKP